MTAKKFALGKGHSGATRMTMRRGRARDTSATGGSERGASRRRAEQVHELSHRAQIFQVSDRVDRACDGGGGKAGLRMGSEFALDLGPRTGGLGRTPGGLRGGRE